MSLQAVEDFRAIAANDPALQQSCAQALLAGRHDEVIAAAAARGLVFTAEELGQCLDSAELSDVELELVSGGSNPVCIVGDGGSARTDKA